MSKSMYSLILPDDVVRAVDHLAGEQGISRSALIGRILAEYLSLTTPQMYAEEIFAYIVAGLERNGSLRLRETPSASTLSLHGSIDYKYSPAIRYDVELPANGAAFRVLTRTRSEALLAELERFFRLWSRLEEGYLSGRPCRYEFAPGRFRRGLSVGRESAAGDSARIGEAVRLYVGLFHRSMNLYFASAWKGEEQLAERIGELYRRYLESTPFIL